MENEVRPEDENEQENEDRTEPVEKKSYGLPKADFSKREELKEKIAAESVEKQRKVHGLLHTMEFEGMLDEIMEYDELAPSRSMDDRQLFASSVAGVMVSAYQVTEPETDDDLTPLHGMVATVHLLHERIRRLEEGVMLLLKLQEHRNS